MDSRHDYVPTSPFRVDSGDNVDSVLAKMRGVSFQGRALAAAVDIWERAVRARARIFLGISGAMVPAGLRLLFLHLVRHGLAHCVVTTGANAFHDLHESLGYDHLMCSPLADDVQLRKDGYDRMYDTLASDEEFQEVDRFVMRVIEGMDISRPLGTPQFFRELGLAVARGRHRPGMLTEAARLGVPVFCPAIGDSSLGIAAALLAERKPERKIVFDAVGDVRELTRLVGEADETCVVFIGGGTPKNFTQQTEVVAHLLGQPAAGHRYCLQFSPDPPHWGGLSGCTFEESQSWGKIHFEADKVNVYVDATIALPFVVTALSQRLGLEADGRI